MRDLSQLSNEELAQIAGVQLPTAQAPELPVNQPRAILEQGLQGLTGNFGDEITNRLGALMASPFVDESYSQLLEEAKGKTEQRLAAQQKQYPKTSMGSQIAGALLGAGALATTAPAIAAGNLAAKGGLLGRIGAGGLAGEATQRIYESGAAPEGEKIAQLTEPGISAGGVIGAAIPGAGALLSKTKQAITPPISEARKQVVSLAKKYNVPLGLDDLTDSQFYQYLISEGQNLPFAGAGSNVENQLSKYTKAIAKSIGLDDVDNLTPVNMDKAFKKVGSKFDDLTKGKTFNITDDALDTLSGIEEGVASGTYGAEGVILFKNHTKDLFSRLKDDSLSGDELASLRNKFARISRTGTNPEAKALAKDMENVLIDLIGEGAPEALKNAKYQYKNLIAVEPLAQKAQVDGFISPALLNSRVAQVYKRDFTRGKAGELGDLALLGQAIKQRVPQSGTAPRQMMQNLGVTDLAALGTGFVNPALPVAYFGGKLGKLGANRYLQSRNVNPSVIESAMNPVAARIGNPIRSGLQAGSVLGNIQQ